MTGLSAIALAVGFNLPYAVLAARFDYPGILRRPPAEVLDAFAAGGGALVLTWYAFALAALLFIPVAVALALTPARIARTPALAIGAALAGALSGLLQAMGLLRWVFVIPGLAEAHGRADATPAQQAATEQSYVLIHAFAGVEVGEHLGQLMLAGFVLALSRLLSREGARGTALVGMATAALIALGTAEGLVLALGGTGAPFGLATIGGFLGLTLWLILAGWQALRRR